MSIRIFMRPDIPPVSWQEFCDSTKEGFSIAFDGYVKGGPRFDPKGPWANFNHHEEVDRLATRATCAQVLMAIRVGLFQTFSDEEGPRVDGYFNDCDQDVCVSWTLVKHGHMAGNAMNPALNRLVGMEDALDATAGAYPYPANLPTLKKLAWVFEPYTQFRLSGEIDKKDPAAHLRVLTDVEQRIMLHIIGEGQSLPLDVRYETIRSGKLWSMVEEIGAQARTAMFSNGVRAFVSVRERKGGLGWTYSIGRMSNFIPFPIPKILSALNEAEGNPKDAWGGGDTIGGSPRVSGSKLSPQEVTRIIESVLVQ